MKQRVVVSLLTLLVAAFFFLTGRIYGQKENTYSLLKIFNRVLSIVQSNYVDPVDDQNLIRGAINGMVDTLMDPHTNYLSKNEAIALRISTEGEFGGIGAQLGMRSNKPVVIAPMDNTPAKRIGLLPGDVILKVDGEPTEGKNLDEVVRRIRGKAGTKVTLLIERTTFAQPTEFVVTRSTIRIDAIPYSGIVKNDIAYIRLADFSRTASAELRGALDSLFGAGAKKVIFDLRYNSGGLLNEGVEVAECFLARDREIVSTRGRIDSLRSFKSDAEPTHGDFPLVVLVDSGSASASEIVAGAIQDWDRGLLMGTNTFGKGSVQHIFPMEDGGAFKITVARWYTPSGRCIDKPRDTVLAKQSPAKAYTTLGPLHRKVSGAGGIMPDTVVGRRAYTWLDMEIIRKGLYFDFAVKYTAKNKEIPKNFDADAALLDEFSGFLAEKKLAFAPAQFDSSKTDIARALEIEIVSVVWGAKTAEALRLQHDHYVAAAIGVIEKAKTGRDLFRMSKK